MTAERPDDVGRVDGLAYTLWLPAAEPHGSVLVIHGAGSSKESHHPWARACRAAGWAALCADLRGHGESEGELGAGVLGDLATLARLLPGGPLVLRGSSMGGYLALCAAGPLGAAGVVAICPAGADHLMRGLEEGSFDFDADAPGLAAFLLEHDAGDAAAALDVPVLLLHAEGDERIPVAHSRALAERLRAPGSRLVAVPGGHHRSVQRDGELQAAALRWMERVVLRGR